MKGHARCPRELIACITFFSEKFYLYPISHKYYVKFLKHTQSIGSGVPNIIGLSIPVRLLYFKIMRVQSEVLEATIQI